MSSIPGKGQLDRRSETAGGSEDFDQYLNEGNAQWARGNFNKALKSFNQAIDENSRDERPWNNKGIVLRNLGKIDDARKSFEKALEINSTNATIKRNLESLNKPIASGTPSYGFGISRMTKNLFPMLVYEVPRIMGTAVVVVSAILFLALFTMFRSSMDLWADNFNYLTMALTSVSFVIILIAIFSQIHYLIPIIQYEIRIFMVYLMGAIIIMLAPFRISLGLASTDYLYSGGNIALFVIGAIFVAAGVFYFYIKGGYFLAWLLGVIIFMITSFHEFFRFIVFSGSFGILDQATANIGIILTFIGLFLYLSRRIFNSLLNRSEDLRRDEKYEEALKIQEFVLKLNPFNEVAWNDKGNVLFTQGDIEGAIDCYNKALELDDKYDIAKHNLDLCKKTASIA
jgi:tetratricopeptide (TPR) repeat protein